MIVSNVELEAMNIECPFSLFASGSRQEQRGSDKIPVSRHHQVSGDTSDNKRWWRKHEFMHTLNSISRAPRLVRLLNGCMTKHEAEAA